MHLTCFGRWDHQGCEGEFFGEIFVCEPSIRVKEFLNCIEILTGVEVAESDLSDGRHRPILHAPKKVYEVTVKVVVHLEGMHLRLAEENASRTAEHIYKPAVFFGKYGV